LTDSLLSSAEFVNSFAGQSNEAFVRALHFNFFDRNINQPEVDDWMARIEAEDLDQGAILRTILYEASADRDPVLVLDYHNQNLYRTEDGSIDTMSVLWATNADVAPALTETGQKAAVAIGNALADYEFSNYTLFPGSKNPALARNGLALEGTATLLIEQRYLEEMFEFTIGLKQDMSAVRSALAFEAFLSMQSLAAALTPTKSSQTSMWRRQWPFRSTPRRLTMTIFIRTTSTAPYPTSYWFKTKVWPGSLTIALSVLPPGRD
jgi:uncharacterized protein DUF4214